MNITNEVHNLPQLGAAVPWLYLHMFTYVASIATAPSIYYSCRIQPAVENPEYDLLR